MVRANHSYYRVKFSCLVGTHGEGNEVRAIQAGQPSIDNHFTVAETYFAGNSLLNGSW